MSLDWEMYEETIKNDSNTGTIYSFKKTSQALANQILWLRDKINMKKEQRYLQDLIITSLFQMAIGAVAFSGNDDTWMVVGGVAIFLMPMLLFLKAKYYYKFF